MQLQGLRIKHRLVARLRRAWRGLHSAVAGLSLPFGGWWLPSQRRLCRSSRLENGLAIVLPGIEGRGPLNWCIAQGINDGGFKGGILIHDWTTGIWPLFPFHLRARRRNRRRAATLAKTIVSYQDAFPGRPVHLIGHSGGGGMAVWTLEALPPGRTVNSAVLLGPALSTCYSLESALKKVETGIWNFWSPLDVFFLVALTGGLGTLDGRHRTSAGFNAFARPSGASQDVKKLYRERLNQRCYSPAMANQFHMGGHFGWANRVFVAETLTPILHAAHLA